MKIIFLSLLVLSISQIINAQSDTASSVLFWQARHITWEDFKGVPPKGGRSQFRNLATLLVIALLKSELMIWT